MTYCEQCSVTYDYDNEEDLICDCGETSDHLTGRVAKSLEGLVSDE